MDLYLSCHFSWVISTLKLSWLLDYRHSVIFNSKYIVLFSCKHLILAVDKLKSKVTVHWCSQSSILYFDRMLTRNNNSVSRFCHSPSRPNSPYCLCWCIKEIASWHSTQNYASANDVFRQNSNRQNHQQI